MSCCDLQPFGNLQTGRRQGLHQGDSNLRGQPNGGIGQWTAADYDTLGPGCLGIQTSGHQGSVQCVLIGQQSLGISRGHEATQITPHGSMDLHQPINQRPQSGCGSGNCEGRAILGGGLGGGLSDADDGTGQTFAKTCDAGITKGGNDHAARGRQPRRRNLSGCRSQSHGVGNHRGRFSVGPALHIRQRPARDGDHRGGRLLRTVGIDHQNRFHNRKFPS